MSKPVIKNSDLKNIIYESKDGEQSTLKSYINLLLFNVFVFGLAIGMLIFSAVSIFHPFYVSNVANQICQSYNGYAVAWQWGIFNSNFANLICKNTYGLIQPLK